jgi:hypothetical protein
VAPRLVFVSFLTQLKQLGVSGLLHTLCYVAV